MSSVDVIVPCYNYGHFLRDCVESVLSQDLPGIRVLIIDDASPDDTAEVAAELTRQDSRVSVLRHSMNRGHIATYNEGLDWVSADYALLLSADDLILPGALRRAAELLDRRPDVGFVYGSFIELWPGDPYPLAKPVPEVPGWTILSGEAFFRANRLINPVATCTAVARTATQKKVGGYRPELPHAGDMEMWLRFAARGPVGRLNSFQAIYRRHPASMAVAYCEDIMRDLRQRKSVLDLVFADRGGSFGRAAELRRYLFRGLAESAVYAANDPFVRGDMGKLREIMEFAREVDPTIHRSFVWRAHKIARFFGPRVFSALRQSRGALRSLAKRDVSTGNAI